MKIQLSVLFFIVSIASTMAFICPATRGTYPHEWNKAVYYRCSRECAYEESCPPKSYYSSNTNQCKLEPPDWSPRFDLTGRYQWPNTIFFNEIRQVGYDVQWTHESNEIISTFVGRYVSETMVTGLEHILTKKTNCIFLQRVDLSVVGRRNFCGSQGVSHWYTRMCGRRVAHPICYVY